MGDHDGSPSEVRKQAPLSSRARPGLRVRACDVTVGRQILGVRRVPPPEFREGLLRRTQGSGLPAGA